MRIDSAQIQKWMADDLEDMSIQANRLERSGMTREAAIMAVAYHKGMLRGMAVNHTITMEALKADAKRKKVQDEP